MAKKAMKAMKAMKKSVKLNLVRLKKGSSEPVWLQAVRVWIAVDAPKARKIYELGKTESAKARRATKAMK